MLGDRGGSMPCATAPLQNLNPAGHVHPHAAGFRWLHGAQRKFSATFQVARASGWVEVKHLGMSAVVDEKVPSLSSKKS